MMGWGLGVINIFIVSESILVIAILPFQFLGLTQVVSLAFSGTCGGTHLYLRANLCKHMVSQQLPNPRRLALPFSLFFIVFIEL